MSEELEETIRIETTTRHIDKDGKVTKEIVLVETVRRESEKELPVGMYL